jgi:ribosome-associated heat shock protein Hsp15
MAEPLQRLRVDKWLWAARFFKTRSLAHQSVEAGRVKVNGDRAKPSRELKVGDRLEIHIGEYQWQIAVLALSVQRGPAPVAHTLYEESPESHARRQQQVADRKLNADPALNLHGRPTKRDRRLIHRFGER